jgi:large subunit ribosomal protein L6
MSRVAKTPIAIPVDVEVMISNQTISVKGKNGKLNFKVHETVKVEHIDNNLVFSVRDDVPGSWAQAGTARAQLNTMIIGVSKGFTKKLQLVGIGYRATIKDNVITLNLGFSHVIRHVVPVNITAKCPSHNEILLSGPDKQAVGQSAAVLRAYRKPDPYKGKGIRYVDEIIRTKETKKK